MTTTWFWQGNGPAAAWTPRTDVVETEQGYQLSLDLPGVKREELDIQVNRDTVTIKGERKLAASPEAYHRVERPYGAFSRVFLLPDLVNQPAIEAKLADGVLNLFLPRREETKPKQIQVQVQ
ncbi:MAG: Hsp20/alpha crystallin family protein [Terriglobales bacterium]